MATTTAPKQRSETAEQILDLAETLIQTRGYSAFSYQDIADSLGIRKASIHYHFPSKADLGVAVVDRYIARFGEALTAIADDQSQSSMTMLDFYVQPYLQFASTPDRVCLSGCACRRDAGAAAKSPRTGRSFLPDPSGLADQNSRARGGARRIRTAGAGVQGGAIRFRGIAGALLVKRTTNDLSQINDVIAVMKYLAWRPIHQLIPVFSGFEVFYICFFDIVWGCSSLDHQPRF